MLSLFQLRVNYIAISYNLVASEDIFLFFFTKSTFLRDAFCLNELCNVELEACREMFLYVNDLLVAKIYSSSFFLLSLLLPLLFSPFLHPGGV